MFRRPKKALSPTRETLILDRLRQERDFMSAINIGVACELRPGDVITGLDHLYRDSLIMARFMLHQKAIIVTANEVSYPEYGFNRNLDCLLIGMGINRGNWAEVTKDYAAVPDDGGFGLYIPEGFGPIEVFPVSVDA